jgi:predicted permease
MIRSLRNLQSEKLGMRTASLLVFGVDPKSQNAQQDPQQTFNFYRRLLQQLKLLPRVEAVTLAGNRPGSGWSNNTGAILDGKSPTRGQSLLMRWNAVGPDFFGTVGVPILYGRDFRDTDSPNSPKVAIVTKTFVNRYLAGGYALGHTVSFTRRFAFTIVGVAADSKYTDIREGATPIAYFPYEQVGAAGGMHVEIRTGGDPTLLLPEVQRLLRAFDPELSPLQPMTQQQQFEISLTNDRLLARLALFFGFVAMVLVATGLYGTVAFSVNRRISELGIRMALGAQRGEVLRMILREGLEIALWGVLIGVPLSLAGMRLLKSLLFGLTPGDPLSIAAATITIVLVTCLACVVPARRASVIDPAVALRNE